MDNNNNNGPEHAAAQGLLHLTAVGESGVGANE